MRSKLWIGALLICLLYAGRSPAALRVALIGAGSDKENGPLIALAEARLSQDARLELLDRTSIRQVLTEQKLSLSGLVDADQAVAVGKLLRAESFAFVESLGDGEPPALVVFDGFSGARLVDIELPQNDVPADVEALALGVDRARQKLAAMAGGMHGRTLCVLAVRNADLPRKMDGICDSVAMLMQRRLLASDDVCLLDRKRLEAINRERQLPTALPASPILASLVCVELEFSRPPNGAGITATALLSNAQGKLLAKPAVTLPKEDVVELAKRLSASIADALHVVPPTLEVDANKEARRFEREATFLLAHGQVEEAMQAAEAAYALDSANPVYSKAVAFALLRYAALISATAGREIEAFELATRAMEIRDSRLLSIHQNDPRNPELRMAPENLLGEWMTKLLERAHSEPLRSDSAASAAAKELGDAYLKFMDDWLAFSEAASAGDPRLLSRHMDYIRLNKVVAVIALASHDPSQYLQEVTGLYARYFQLIGKLDRQSALSLYILAAQDLGAIDYRGAPQRSWPDPHLQPSDLARIDQLFSLLEQSDQPAVRFYGLRDRLLFEKSGNPPSSSDCQAIYDKAREAARQAMDDPDMLAADHLGILRNHVYTDAMLLLVALRLPSRPTLAERLDWYDFMFARHEIPLGALLNLRWLAQGHAMDAEEAGFLKQLTAMIDSPQSHFLGGSRQEAQAKLAEQTRILSGIVPQMGHALEDSAKATTTTFLQAGRDTGIDAIEQVLVADGVAYAIVSAHDNGQRQLQALRVPLDGEKAQLLGSIPSSAAVNDACADGQRLFVATKDGILIYPMHGEGVMTLTQKDGLPADSVQSLSVLNDVIYAGLNDGGYLIAYDLKARHCQVLASSRRKQKSSPFDDTPLFEIPRIVADPSQRRILLVQRCLMGRLPQNGLWAFDPRSGQFTQLLKLYYDYDVRCGSSRLLPDGRLLIFSYNWALAFDTKRDTSQLLFAFGDVGPDIAKDSPPFRYNRQVQGPFSLVGSELWACKPICRIDPQTSQVQPVALPSVHASGNANASWIEPLPGGAQVLVGNAQGLWLSGSPTPKTPEPTTQP